MYKIEKEISFCGCTYKGKQPVEIMEQVEEEVEIFNSPLMVMECGDSFVIGREERKRWRTAFRQFMAISKLKEFDIINISTTKCRVFRVK